MQIEAQVVELVHEELSIAFFFLSNSLIGIIKFGFQLLSFHQNLEYSELFMLGMIVAQKKRDKH